MRFYDLQGQETQIHIHSDNTEIGMLAQRLHTTILGWTRGHLGKVKV